MGFLGESKIFFYSVLMSGFIIIVLFMSYCAVFAPNFRKYGLISDNFYILWDYFNVHSSFMVIFIIALVFMVNQKAITCFGAEIRR